MPKPTILFKAPAVSVYRQPAQDGTSDRAVMMAGNQLVLLEAGAAELLVSYLQVIRAYFISFPDSRKIIADFYGSVTDLLAKTTYQNDNQIVTNRHVSDMIQQLGCIDNWQKQYNPIKV